MFLFLKKGKKENFFLAATNRSSYFTAGASSLQVFVAAEVGTPRTRELFFFLFCLLTGESHRKSAHAIKKKKSNHERSRKYLHNSHHSAWVTQTDAHDRVKTRVHSASTNNSRAVWPQCSYKLAHTKKSPAVFKKKKKKKRNNNKRNLRSHKAVNEVVTKFKHRLQSAPHTNTHVPFKDHFDTAVTVVGGRAFVLQQWEGKTARLRRDEEINEKKCLALVCFVFTDSYNWRSSLHQETPGFWSHVLLQNTTDCGSNQWWRQVVVPSGQQQLLTWVCFDCVCLRTARKQNHMQRECTRAHLNKLYIQASGGINYCSLYIGVCVCEIGTCHLHCG